MQIFSWFPWCRPQTNPHATSYYVYPLKGTISLGHHNFSIPAIIFQLNTMECFVSPKLSSGWRWQGEEKDDIDDIKGHFSLYIKLIFIILIYLLIVGICPSREEGTASGDGQVYVWHGYTNSSPRSFDVFRNIPITRVAIGAHHCAFLTSDLEVFTYGNNQHGQLGDGTFTDCLREPQLVEALKG